MTANSLAINGLYSDPYFMQALNSPNYYSMFQGQTTGNQLGTAQAATTNATAATTAASNPTFTGIPRATQTEKSSSLAAPLAIGTTIVGVGAWIASRGRAAGAKGLMNSLKAGLKSFGKESKSVANSTQIRNINGQNVISLPGYTRGMNIGTTTNATSLANKAQSLGLEVNQTLSLADDAAKLHSTHFTFKFGKKGGKTYEGIYRKGELVGLKEGGKKVDLDKIDDNLRAKLDGIVKELSTKKSADGVTLTNTTYIQSFDGGQAMFLANATGKNASKNGLRVVETNRHKINDEVVIKAQKNDEKLKQAIADYNAGKFDSWNITEGVWRPSKSKSFWEKWGIKQSSEYEGVITGEKWDDAIELVVKDNKVIGLSKDGGKTIFARAASDKFGRYEADFPQIFEDALKHNKDFTGNITRTLA